MAYWSVPLLILVSSGVIAVLLFSLSGGCTLSKSYFCYLPIAVSLHICSSTLELKALKTGNLSEVFPLISLSPLFMLITSPLIGGEFPRLITIPGILLIVVGAYLLNLFCNLKAYSLTLAINVVSVKRLSNLFSILFAGFVLKENNIKQRMLAAVVMVIGVLWVGFAP